MNAHMTPARRGGRALLTLLVLSLAADSLGVPLGVFAAEPTGEPAAAASPTLSTSSSGALCESADDLSLIIGFLRDTSISQDGLVPVIVGTIAGISEARTLAGLVGETYRPLVDDVIVALQDLQATLQGYGAQETLGAEIALIGEAITDVGDAMDALGLALRTPCPVEVPAVPEASADPGA